MEQEQTNRVTMFTTTEDYLDRHNAVWNSMVPMVTAVQSLKDKILAIHAAAQLQEGPSGAADSKAAARDALESVTFLACEALGVLAHQANDHDLRALTNVTPTFLDKVPADELINRATLVLERANARKTELATLQVTQANLDELTQAIDTFSSLKNQPRSASVERSVHTQSLESLIREANGILRDEIDRLVNLFKRSNPEFVAGYQNARVIVDRAASHKTKTAGAAPPPPASV